MAGTEVKRRIEISREKLWALALAHIESGNHVFAVKNARPDRPEPLEDALSWAADQLAHLERIGTLEWVIGDPREEAEIIAAGRELVQRFTMDGDGPTITVERIVRPRSDM